MNDRSIEPKILPLVEAINWTKLFRTFSSCQGHYGDDEQDQYMDRNNADVRFDPLEGTTLEMTEHFITYLMTEFDKRHSFAPIILTGYKLYAPDNDYRSSFVFVIELKPFDREKKPIQKRNDTDKAILQAAAIVKEYMTYLSNIRR